MTALTVPARPEEDASPRPVPWRRMAWVTWRQHRFALGGVAVFLGAWAVYLWLAGLRTYHAYAAATACHPVSSIACGEILANFNYKYDGEKTPFAPEVFDLRAVAFPAWTLAAFAIGALAGMLIRRVVPAIAATLAVYAGLALAAGLYLRQHYMTPLFTRNPNVPGSAWIMSQWWTKGGTFAFTGQPPRNLVMQICPPSGPGKEPVETITQCVAQHGYTQWTSYQPGSRFWPFQWIEGGWLLALSVLLIAATVWLVRRRAA